jgi:copper chaperone CopZ
MKLPRLFLALLVAFAAPLFAADPVTYVGEITGVVCGACKEHVTEALMKVDGVKSVEIDPTNVPEIRHITVKATKENFSASDANNALAAAHGETYKVTKLAKK